MKIPRLTYQSNPNGIRIWYNLIFVKIQMVFERSGGALVPGNEILRGRID